MITLFFLELLKKISDAGKNDPPPSPKGSTSLPRWLGLQRSADITLATFILITSLKMLH